VREKSSYEIIQIGKLDDGTTMRARVHGNGDPGVESTSRMLVESALCLAEDVDRISVGGGFWTPASAMGNLLLTRLPAHAGLAFEMM
jgi:saccharopine dehydrogenase (NAD+, L-glutamate forming)